MTPMTVVGSSLTRICRPTIDGSPPKRRSNRSQPSRIVGGAPGALSSARNVRPSALSAPRTWKKLEVTNAERSCSGSPSPDSATVPVAQMRAELGARRAAFAQVRADPDRRAARAGIRSRPVEPDEHEPVGVAIRQRLEQHRAHDAEDRGVRADAERERDDHDGGEAGGRPETAPGVAEIEQERIEARSDAPLAHVFLDADDAAGTAERRDGGAPRGLGAHAPGQMAVDERLLGRADLLVQLPVERRLAEQRVPEARQSRQDAHGLHLPHSASFARIWPMASAMRAQCFFSAVSCRWPDAVIR